MEEVKVENNLNLEESFDKIDELILKLNGDISLEDSIKLYGEGMQLVAACQEKLKEMDGKLQNLKEASNEL